MASAESLSKVLTVLKNCMVEGNVVKLPDGKLDRSIYTEVKKQLELIGGRWKGGRVCGFQFEVSNEDLQELLDAQAKGDGRNLKKEFQFFETPDEVGRYMMKDIAVEYNQFKDLKVLEPSAGNGALIKSFHKYVNKNVTVDCIELMDLNRFKLQKLPNVNLIGKDFLNIVDIDKFNLIRGQYDVIIANPPFSGNQDIDHILAMYRCLKSKGRILTISSKSWVLGNQKKQVQFKEWLDEVGAYQEELPAGMFKDSGTNVSSMYLVIDKVESEAVKNEIHMFSIKNRENDDSSKMLNGANATGDEGSGESLDKSILINNNKSELCMKKITVKLADVLVVLKKMKEVLYKGDGKRMHPGLPVLDNVRVFIAPGSIAPLGPATMTMVASDIVLTVMGEVLIDYSDEPVEVLLNFEYLLKIFEVLHDDEVVLELRDIKGGGHKVRVMTEVDSFDIGCNQGLAEWPVLPALPAENALEVDWQMVEAMDAALATVSKDMATRPAMGCVYVGVRVLPADDTFDQRIELCVASTDAHALYEMVFRYPSAGTHWDEVVVTDKKPVKHELLLLPKMVKAMRMVKDTAKMVWNDGHMGLVYDNLTIIGQLMDQKYPNYKAVIPVAEPNMDVERAAMIGNMGKLSLTGQSAVLWLKREIGYVVLESEDTDLGRHVVVRMPADYGGDVEFVRVSPDNMLRVLGQVACKGLKMAIIGTNKGLVLTSDDADGWRGLVMPVHSSK